MKKAQAKLVIIIAVIVVVVISMFLIVSNDSKKDSDKDSISIFLIGKEISTPSGSSDSKSEDKASGASQKTSRDKIILTTELVIEHSSPSNCWIIIEGVVYDLTEYAPRHPGGSLRITNLCGKDGSSIFKDKHKQSTLKKVSQYIFGNLGDEVV